MWEHLTKDGVPKVLKASVAVNVPTVRVHRTTNQAITHATITAVSFPGTETWDTDGMHDPASNDSRITARTAGKYLVTGQVFFNGHGTGIRDLYIMKNGAATYLAVERADGSANGNYIHVTAIVDMVVGDYVELKVYQSSGGSLDLVFSGDNAQRFEAIYLGPGLASSGERAQFVSTLPATAGHGEEAIFSAGASGENWHYKYNAYSASAHKWECIGGMPVQVQGNHGTMGVNSAWTPVTSMALTAIRAGDYLFCASMTGVGASGGAATHNFGISQNSTTAVVGTYGSTVNPAASYAYNVSWSNVKITAAAGDVFRLMYWSNGSTATLAYNNFSMIPIRVT